MSAARPPHVAAGDCERIRAGAIAQPVNTASSLLLVLAGAAIRRDAADAWWRVAGVTTMAAGVGSSAYHGPGGRLGRVVHDLGVAAMAAGVGAAVLRTPPQRPGMAQAAAVVGLAGAAVHTSSRTGGPLCRPEALLQGHAVWHGLVSLAAWLAAGSRRRG